jgi:hypothetical protein
MLVTLEFADAGTTGSDSASGSASSTARTANQNSPTKRGEERTLTEKLRESVKEKQGVGSPQSKSVTTTVPSSTASQGSSVAIRIFIAAKRLVLDHLARRVAFVNTQNAFRLARLILLNGVGNPPRASADRE